jgi:hypothetical protein
MGRIGNRGRRESFINRGSARQEAGGCRTRFDDRKEGGSRGSRSAFGRVCSPPTAASQEGRVVHHQGRSFRSGPVSAHVAYLERDGVTRDGEKGCTFGATEDHIDAMAFARATSTTGIISASSSRRRMRRDDRPQGLCPRPRHLVGQMESDLGTGLGDGIAHGNTDTRVCIPRYAASQMTVPISSSRAITSARPALAGCGPGSAELGSKPEHEIRSALAREVEAERWTSLDAAIRMAADDSASSTCGWTIRASTIRRRAVSPSAVCRSWSASGSPRLQGRANE